MVRDGYIYGLSLLAVAFALAWATGNWAWSIPPLLLAAFFLWFFRDPHRAVPAGDGLIVSPGDGLVTETVAIATPDGPRQRISIFLSVFDVHVNRSPIGGASQRPEAGRATTSGPLEVEDLGAGEMLEEIEEMPMTEAGGVPMPGAHASSVVEVPVVLDRSLFSGESPVEIRLKLYLK